MDFALLEEKQFKYIETNPGKEPLVLLHGLFGAMSNFESLINSFKGRFNVVVPILPLYDLPIFSTSIKGLLKYLEDFI